MSGPLDGIRVVELAGIGPGPLAGQLLADLGADVISIDRKAESILPDRPKDANRRNKRSISINLKADGAADIVLKLCADADIFFEGFRPGVAERLGLGPEAVHAVNPAMVYGRLTGWGQTGPLSDRAGHDINYIAISGALAAIGPKDHPVPPLNLVGDYAGGSLMLVYGLMAALVSAKTTGKGQIVDTAMTDGSAAIMSMIHSILDAGLWQNRREANYIDGGAPFYRCYETADGKFMAVGALEPQFFALLLEGLGADADWSQRQHDRNAWPEMEAEFARRFRTKTRDEWAAVFEPVDACVSPVLDMIEARSHPHNVARQTFVAADGYTQPAPAPRFSGHDLITRRGAFFQGEDTSAILTEAGYSEDEIGRMIDSGKVEQAR
ncbi:CaiB/BaiF CoA-transferase family protein [Hyphobacterium sp. HN65]|uniref:CaiB/BaiF CoA-transferase family protein n=1 Tax=Hyphobacterium lacteum TaxID=3116575 RepID=A0ABU7LNT8_9PROT|nr:CaiB/BaiF CoA-transferase family protein [Hyphobacterium sp. HN65]MEE2525580.1 CaiB/BaiF CoA-transferase family protein [Hyphobacterium sp. HN65]